MDHDCTTTCVGCSTQLRLGDIQPEQLGDVTTYVCSSCGTAVVGVKRFKEDAEPRERGGFRLGDWVIGSKADIVIALPGAAKPMKLDARPGFFT
ncbi:MAG: hypothetical protein JHD16_00660 [Solirubrobacteraceae bacterium]|nr:hypothetical protein [Solirubrobacteraceae bacterium]